jgi:hypothetical protein
MDVEGAHALVLPAFQPALEGVVDLAVFTQPFGAAGHIEHFIGPDAVIGAGLAVLLDLGSGLSSNTVLKANVTPAPREAFLLAQGGAAGQDQQPGQDDQVTEFHGCSPPLPLIIEWTENIKKMLRRIAFIIVFLFVGLALTSSLWFWSFNAGAGSVLSSIHIKRTTLTISLSIFISCTATKAVIVRKNGSWK